MNRWKPAANVEDARERARLAILDCASEDCYLICEFLVGLKSIYAFFDGPDRAIRALIEDMVAEGTIQVHSGRQCSFPYRAPAALNVAPEHLPSLDDRALGMLCVCYTDATTAGYS